MTFASEQPENGDEHHQQQARGCLTSRADAVLGRRSWRGVGLGGGCVRVGSFLRQSSICRVLASRPP